MARNKEALVLLLDVGPSMHGVLQEVENICSTLVHKKLVYNRSDEIGVVLFGTKETSNELAKELGGYKHVVVARDIKVVDEETTNALQNLPRGTSPGD
ncbi:Os03g0856200 [Oryza sativa Japonica Group]|nr:hypothetical protein EE612_021742 [Oryza sativa]BAH92449.1 Os03g0856200 [Oryza sativa Japonica Group]BAS87446.1 Os03g0856200 [Oryza sativa Japonica Group]|eukprot:NP_001173721.1 Os03g0856200 [Oryza sativa Japonica Group]